MVDALNSILSFFEMIGQFVLYLINGLAQLFMMIPSAFAMLTVSIGTLPSVLLAFATVAISISIIFLIIGR